jgi:hypothetical protein
VFSHPLRPTPIVVGYLLGVVRGLLGVVATGVAGVDEGRLASAFEVGCRGEHRLW